MRAPASILCSGCLLFLLSVQSLRPQVAQAQAAAEAEQTEFDRVLKQALGEFDLGNWTEARALFERAHELRPSARTLRAIAMCAFEEKSYVAAIVHAQKALDDERKSLDGKQRKQMEQLLERAHGFVARIQLALTPSDAEVRVDLKPPTFMEGRLMLDPGEHELLVRAQGYQEAQHRIVVRPREERQLNLALVPMQVATATEPERKPSAPTVTESAPRGLGTRRRGAIGVAAAGVAALGTGAVFGILAKGKRDDAGCEDGLCPDAAAKRDYDRAITYAHVSTGTVIAGAVLTGAGAALFFWPNKEPEDARHATARVSPALGRTFAGLSVKGTW